MPYKFEDYCLDAERQELRRGTDPVSLEPQVFDLLQYLICNRERVVSRDELITEIWGGRFISDSTLTSRVAAARKSVNDSGKQQRLIRTISRKGLRFVGEVEELRASGPAYIPHDADPALALLHGAKPELPDKPSIAVLPFTNMSGDSGQEYLSDGFTEDIITALSRLRWFFVIARNSTFAYKARPIDVRQIAQELGVQYVLEGSVRKNNARLRISAQLVDGGTGAHLWAETYDRELGDLFALQNDISASISSAIEPRLVEAEGIRAERRAFPAFDAWDLVARALTRFWRLTAADSESANTILRRAVALHPDYAPAHSILAFSLLVAGHMGWTSPDKGMVQSLASRALALDQSDPWAYMALGYLAFSARRTDEAVSNFFVAISLNPNFAAAYGYAGWAQAHDGRTQEAIKNLQKAIRMSPLDPFNVFYSAGFAAAHYVEGQYTNAVEWARQALVLRPDHLGARRKLCASLAQAGLIAEARLEMVRMRELQPGLSLGWIKQAVPYTPGPMEKFLDGMRKAGLFD